MPSMLGYAERGIPMVSRLSVRHSVYRIRKLHMRFRLAVASATSPRSMTLELDDLNCHLELR